MGGWALKTDQVEHWAFQTRVFSPKQCKWIINFCKKKGLMTAGVDVQRPRKNKKIRDSRVCWLNHNECPDVYAKLTDVINELNNKYFNFDLFGFMEDIQFTEYRAPGGHYGKHIDRASKSSARKLSVTLQLSDPSTYEGGDLEIYIGDKPDKAKREQGCCNVFPSYVLHQVTPVTKGTRYSLVAWIGGPDFK